MHMALEWVLICQMLVVAAVPAAYCIVAKIPIHEILYEEHGTKDVQFCLAFVGERLLVHHSDEASC